MKIEYSLDVLKPHQPSNDLLARSLKKIQGVTYVKIKIDEIDQKTTSIFIDIIGNDISLEVITQILEEMNCSLHSVDMIIIDDNS